MAMANDVEYVQAQIDAAGNTGAFAGKPAPPRLTEWSQLAELVSRVVAEVEALKIVTISANSKKGSKKPEQRPVLRPAGVMVELLRKKRIENHLSLRARLLPGKYGTPPDGEAPPVEEEKSWRSRVSSVVHRR